MDHSMTDPGTQSLQPWRCSSMYSVPACDLRDMDTNQDKQSLLPNAMPQDPRQWSHQQVCLWLEWCVQQFSLPPVDLENFHMNGRALCLLTKSDFKDRVPRVGDVLFNTLHILAHKSNPMQPNVSNMLLGQAAAEKGTLSMNRYWARSADSEYQSYAVQQDNNSSNTSTPSGGGSGGDVDSTVILSPAPSTEGPIEKGAELVIKRNLSNGQLASDEEDDVLIGRNKVGPVQLHATNLVVGGGTCIPTNQSPDMPQEKSVRLLWDFLQQLLNDQEQRYKRCIAWKEKCKGVFKIVDPHQLAYLWGMQKNHHNMNFDKMSRALRYYYRVKILQKEPGERHCYRFLRHPNELRNCKQRSLLAKSNNNNANNVNNNNSVALNLSENNGVLDMSIKDEWNAETE